MELVALTFWPYVPAYPPCSGKPMAGSANLQVALLDRFDRSFDYGIYNCRALTTNASVPSIHSDGRAGDLGFPDARTGLRSPVTTPHEQGYEAVEILRAKAFGLGIMGIIWDRRRWDHRTPWGRAYTGPNPHTNHVHWEQVPIMAAQLTLANAYQLIGDPPMAFTPFEELSLKALAAQSAFLVSLAKSITTAGPSSGTPGNSLSMLHVLETHRLVARELGVSGDNHEEIAKGLLSGRLLGQ